MRWASNRGHGKLTCFWFRPSKFELAVETTILAHFRTCHRIVNNRCVSESVE